MLKKILSWLKTGLFKIGDILLWLALTYTPFTTKLYLDVLVDTNKIIVRDTNHQPPTESTIVNNTTITNIINILLASGGTWKVNNMFIPTVDILFYKDAEFIQTISLGSLFLNVIGRPEQGWLMKDISRPQYNRLVE